jgi:hypothetical protein
MSVSSLSNVSRIGQINAARRNEKTSRLDWDQIPTKGMTSLSKEEIFAEVREMTIKEVNATNDKERAEYNQKKINLFCQYMSSASPDRKTLLAEGLQTISKHYGGGMPQGQNSDIKCLLDFIMEAREKRVSKQGGTYHFGKGGSVEASYRPSDDSMVFEISHNGNKVFKIDNNSTGWIITPNESKLRAEISDYSQRIRDNAIKAKERPIYTDDMDFKA